ncbi:DUF6302 family protein [Streptomyces sp. H036]|uniref:DUF6302 family protein n=1 Tax=Streptomyces sp. H036 TaxID=1519487 RepID=UPI0006AEB3A5|nr:DUF6302 family protein [Streptomyces sp. H036]KOV48703.1 hypothetical protein ADK98_09610 [Streptomyces sp. H036]
MIPFRQPSEPLLGVQLLAATAAYDYEYWESRLVNPGLLGGAVAVALYRLPLLAVPVGTDRRGGFMDMAHPVLAEALADALRGRPGFDQVTASGQVVTWGEPMPEGLAPDARRRFQGLWAEPRYGPCIRPPAGHGGRDSGVRSWSPAPGSPPERQPTPPRAVVAAGAAHAP